MSTLYGLWDEHFETCILEGYDIPAVLREAKNLLRMQSILKEDFGEHWKRCNLVCHDEELDTEITYQVSLEYWARHPVSNCWENEARESHNIQNYEGYA